MMASKEGMRVTLTNEKRLEIIRILDEQARIPKGPGRLTEQELASRYGVNQSVISRLSKNRKELAETLISAPPAQKRKRDSAAPEIEMALKLWYDDKHERHVRTNGPMLAEKASEFAFELDSSFKPTQGWLSRWKRRHELKFKKVHGEKLDADLTSAGQYVATVLPQLIKDYRPCDIFNADETGLYWRALPDGTTAKSSEQVSGCKVPKERVTLLIVANMDGSEQLDPLVIGKAKQPVCFKNAHIPLKYTSNKNAWMTAEIWREWLFQLNASMKLKKRHIILFVDNCSAHKNDQVLSNVKLEFLPPNTTSLIQPCDQGIIRNFKYFYRSIMMKKIISIIDSHAHITSTADELSKHFTLLDGLRFAKQAWRSVTATTIKNCFTKAGFRHSDEVLELEQESEPTVPDSLSPFINSAGFAAYVDIDSDLATFGELTDAQIVELVRNQDADVESDAELETIEPPPPPTYQEALRALNVLHDFLFSSRRAADALDLMTKAQDMLHDARPIEKQTLISDFFAKRQ